MAHKIFMVRMGQTMKEGTVVQWFKEDGETVRAGDNLYEIEYDKATANIQSSHDGILKIQVQAGETVPVSTVVGSIVEPGENASAEAAPAPAAQAPKTTPEASAEGVRASLSVKRMARQMGIDITKVIPGVSGRITQEDLEKYAAGTPAAEPKAEPQTAAGVKASPMAKRLAEEHGIDLQQVQPSDPSGRITKEDVQRHRESSAAQVPVAVVPAAGEKAVPMSGMRKAIARNMVKSYFECPVVTYSTDADMSEMIKLRSELNEELAPRGVKLSITDLLIKAAAKALQAKPHINVSLDGDTVLYKSEINIGIAVALENGLVVPVVRNADTMRLEEISQKTKELIGKCKDGRVTSADMSGGTFTITNLGMLEIDMFTPIINLPQCAILGIGRTVAKPVAVNGEIAVRPMMVLSLTADHRVVDGAPAAEFLVELKKYIQKPFLLLMD